jgi:hypothetical protein
MIGIAHRGSKVVAARWDERSLDYTLHNISILVDITYKDPNITED